MKNCPAGWAVESVVEIHPVIRAGDVADYLLPHIGSSDIDGMSFTVN